MQPVACNAFQVDPLTSSTLLHTIPVTMAAHAIIDPVATLEKIRSLYDAKLYPSAKFMAGMLLSAFPKLNDKNASSIESETTVIFADCLFHNCEHRRAMTYYERALQTHKTAKSGKKRHEISDIEIRIKYARCCVQLHEHTLAKSVLEGIPDRLRTIEILSMLANLNEEMGDIKMAVEYYRLILRQHPHAIEAYISLLRHGLSFQEVSQYLPMSDGDWIRTYIQAQANNITFKYDEAIEAFQGLSNLFKHNVDCLLSLADANLMINNTVEAYYLYSQVRRIDPNVVEGMDKYANLIKNQGKSILVNRIADELHRINSQRPECWLAMALYCDMKDEREKALLFVDKAITLDQRHVEAYQLKGSLLQVMGRHAEAITAFRRAYRLSKDLFVCRGLAETYLAIPKIKEAMNVANEALALMPRNPIALTLVGMVMAQSPETKDKARDAFETALKYDPKCLEPVFALVSMNLQEQKVAESIALMEKYLPHNPTDVMHTRLAEVYMRADDFTKALHHYNAALSLNPDYDEAREGLTRLEKRISTGYDDDGEEDGEDLGDHTMESEVDEML